MEDPQSFLLNLFFNEDSGEDNLIYFVGRWRSFLKENVDLFFSTLHPCTLHLSLELRKLLAANPPPNAAEFLASIRASPQDILSTIACAAHILLVEDSAIARKYPSASAVASAALTNANFMNGNIDELSVPSETLQLVVAGVIKAAPTLVRVLLSDADNVLPFSSLRSNQIGRLVSFAGVVCRLHPPQPLVHRLGFQCVKCKACFTRFLPEGKYEPPAACVTARCSNRYFLPQRGQADAVDVQRFRLQELISDSFYETGNGKEEERRTPGRSTASIDCEVTGALTNGFLPGDRIIVTGIVKAMYSHPGAANLVAPHAVDGSRLGGSKSLYTLYVSAVAIVSAISSLREQQVEQLRVEVERFRHVPSGLSPLPWTAANIPFNWRDFQAETRERNSSITAKRRMKIELTDVNPDSLSFDGNGVEMGLKSPQDTARLLDFVAEFHATEPFRFELLAVSLAPGIVGRPLVKAGLLLALLGGVTVDDNPQQGMNCGFRFGVGQEASCCAPKRRGNIHVLLVGDAGVGKSRLLQAVCAAAACDGNGSSAWGTNGSVFVCGNTASAAGLTATVVRDAGTGDLVLEAGAVVLADGGVCCLDELDKMPAVSGSAGDAAALLEAMEQQTVSIAKATCCCRLPARTSIIAAANPKDGSFGKSIRENLRLSLPMLSRFDLVYLIVDTPAASQESRVAASALKGRCAGAGLASRNVNSSDRTSVDATMCLEGRLLALQETEVLPLTLLRAYLAYAKEHVRPMLSDKAATCLKIFFFSLRDQQLKGDSEDTLPVTIRQLEALIRLSQARARADLNNVVTVAHVKDVIEIFCATAYVSPRMLAAAASAVGFRSDATYSTFAPVPMGRKAKKGLGGLVQAFVEECTNFAASYGDRLISGNDVSRIARMVIGRSGAVHTADRVIGAANEAGYILKKQGKWEVFDLDRF